MLLRAATGGSRTFTDYIAGGEKRTAYLDIEKIYYAMMIDLSGFLPNK